ncbi:MAG: type II toxin-antitoxin system VapC family toxin [Pseudomonadota bacterium]
MILVDTSVWVDHLRKTNDDLVDLLEAGQVTIHPFIVGEIALGSLQNRTTVLTLLDTLKALPKAQDNEVRLMIEKQSLFSRGIGWVDAHLIAAAQLASPMLIWTRDKRFGEICDELGIGFAL